MLRPPRLVAAVLVVFACLAVAPTASAAARPTPMERSVLRIVNQVRAAHGLQRVRFAWPLQTQSRRYAVRLLRTGRFRHGRLPPYSRENLAWATTNIASARQIVNMWMRSPGHRATLLWRPARRAGVGIVRGRYRGFPDVRLAVLRFRLG